MGSGTRVSAEWPREGECLSNATAGGRTPISPILSFGAGSLPLSALGIAMAISVQPYWAQNLGVGLVTIAGALFTVRMLDLGVDVVLAMLMDRTNTRIGRYRIWTIIGSPILML